MSILLVNGSSLENCSNSRLLNGIKEHYSEYQFVIAPDIRKLPLFLASKDQAPYPDIVIEWKKATSAAHALVICTPEYIHNIPAVLKNALEWLTSSGELNEKRVLPITYTPHPPRGEMAMTSLLNSLQALGTKVVASLPLYQNELKVENGTLVGDEGIELITEALLILRG